MRDTILNQIKRASFAYIVQLNDPRDAMHAHRYAVYLAERDCELEILWPQASDDPKAAKKEAEEAGLYSLTHSKREKYPAYHLALSGCGYSKTHDVAMQIAKTNPAIEVYVLNGGSPSRVAV